MYTNNSSSALPRMHKLIEQIREADIAYYKYDNPVLPDIEYDKLFDELLALETATDVIISGSPTQTVAGEILESLRSVPHSKPMLSADKIHTIEEAAKFVAMHASMVSFKLDGLTLILRYDQGELQLALTRGKEGLAGEDVTHCVRVMQNVPLKIPYKYPMEIRGEGVISWDNFNELNKTLDEPYSHPRNLAAGSIRKHDATKVKDRKLDFIAFDMVTEIPGVETKSQQLDFLMDNGFDVVHHVPLIAGVTEENIKYLFDGWFDRKQSPYAVDGLIIEYDDLAYGASLGATGHHEKRMCAYKWEDKLYETEFLGLIAATTKSGMVSLKALVKAVEIGGNIVEHPYLHNINNIEKLKLGIGDKVMVYRANDVIPQIASNITQSNTVELPSCCPCCGGELVERSSEGGTRQLYCENDICSAQLIRRFEHFCEKTRMDVEGISESTLEKLVENGWIENFGDLYELGRYKEEIVKTEGFGEKSFEKIQTAITASKNRPLNQFIAGLGIHTIGRTAGRVLNQYFEGSWDAFEQAIKDGFDFTTLPDFGPIMHDNIYAWYHNPTEEALWRPALKHITFTKEIIGMSSISTDNPFYGKTVVATGKLNNYSRDEIQTRLMGLGAKPSSSVSKKTDYVIVGDIENSNKLSKAAEYGVPILSEEEFEEMVG